MPTVTDSSRYARSLAAADPAVDAFAVARVDEGLTFRSAGVKTPIVLLEGVFDAEQMSAAAAADFELVVHASEQIELLKSAPEGATFKIWLKLDSGMNRLGFKRAQFDAAHAALGVIASVRQPVNLFTHLSSADTPELPTTNDQLALFEETTGLMQGERSIENSAALLGFPNVTSRLGASRFAALRRLAVRSFDRGRFWVETGDDAAFASHCSQASRSGRACGIRRRVARRTTHESGDRRGRATAMAIPVILPPVRRC